MNEPVLTPRETEVLTLMASGISSQELADILFVAKRTIDFHKNNIYKKLGVNNRLKAVNAARLAGLIAPG